MVIYATLTDVNLGKLMMAGFLPGLLTIGCYIVVIAAVTAIWPGLGPAGAPPGRRGRLRARRRVGRVVPVFTVALGGIYVGVFTPTEAAGIGAFGAFVLAAVRRRLTRAQMVSMILDTALTTSTIFFVVIGALIFANLVTASGSAGALQQWVASL